MNTNQFTGITLILTLVVGVLLLPTAPSTDQNNDELTRQERYERTCLDNDNANSSPNTNIAGEAPPAPIQFTNQSCKITNETISLQFTLKNEGQFIQSPGYIVGNIIAGNTGLGFTLQLQALPQITPIKGHELSNITLTKMTGSLQCPNEMATFTFNTPNPINKTVYWIDLRHDIPNQVSAQDDFYCKGTNITNYP